MDKQEVPFSERLRSIMEKLHVSVSKLSKDTGIAPSTISNYRMRTRECGINNLALLARYLNVSADYLLGLDNDLEENFTASTSDCSLLDEIQSSRDFSDLVQAYEEYQNDHRIALRLKAQAMALSYYEDDARIPPDELQKILPAWNPDELKQAQKRESIQLGKVKMVLNKILIEISKSNDDDEYQKDFDEARDRINEDIETRYRELCADWDDF